MFEIENIKDSIINGHILEVIKNMPSNSIDTIITSPPYFGLRNYGTESLIWDNKESCNHNWIKVNKSCSGGTGYKQDTNSNGCWFDRDIEYCNICGAYKGELGLEPFIDDQIINGIKIKGFVSHIVDIMEETKRVLKPTGVLFLNIGDSYYRKDKNSKELPDKCLAMIPQRIAIKMIEKGWILRNNIAWYKRNAFPSPAKDRFSPDWENIFMFVKSKIYYFKQQYVDITNYDEFIPLINCSEETETVTKGMRCVWDIPIEAFSSKKLGLDNDHFATFPKKLVEIPIEATCPENGIVLDIFGGTLTTGVVAKKMNRNFIGIELNKEYCKIALRRLEKEANFFDTKMFNKDEEEIKDERTCKNCTISNCMLRDIDEICGEWSDK